VIPVLRFSDPPVGVHGRAVRLGSFERRSRLPIAAVCVVANTVREILSALLARPVSVALCEPVIPAPETWPLLTAGAAMFRARGRLTDGAFILRPKDAVGLTAGIFGEECDAQARALSAIEADVLQRAMASLAKALASVCGLRDEYAITRCAELSGYSTYFELVFETPFQATLGVALCQDPVERISRTLDSSHLLEVEVEAAARFAVGSITMDTLMDLKAGSLLPFDTRLGASGTLTVAGGAVTAGECGVIDRRNVFLVHASGK